MIATIAERIDAIERRQVHRFLDHLRATNQITERLARDYRRSVSYIMSDIKQELATENRNAYAE